MNMNLRRRLKDWLRRFGLRQTMLPNDDAILVHRLARAIQRTREEEYSCEEAYRLLDEFTKHVHRGEEAALIMPLVQVHLDICGPCREEFEALLIILE